MDLETFIKNVYSYFFIADIVCWPVNQLRCDNISKILSGKLHCVNIANAAFFYKKFLITWIPSELAWFFHQKYIAEQR